MFPVDGSNLDLGATEDMSFLDPWISQQVQARLVPATPYRPGSSVKKRRRKSSMKLVYVYKAPEGAMPGPLTSGPTTITKVEPSIYGKQH